MGRRLLELTDRQLERRNRTGAAVDFFARVAGVRVEDVSLWERHQKELPPERVFAIREALDRLEVSR
jgi:DNA-binding transcriptional regulator YiaG